MVYAEVTVVGGEKNYYDPELWQKAVVSILQETAVDAKNKTVEKMGSGIFKNPTGRGATSIKVKNVEDGADLFADPDMAPYLIYQEDGVRAHKMEYLIDARSAKTGEPSPIPIKTPGGKMIFVWPNAKRIRAGEQFFHPGYGGKRFFRDSVDEAVKEAQAKYKEIGMRVKYNI